MCISEELLKNEELTYKDYLFVFLFLISFIIGLLGILFLVLK